MMSKQLKDAPKQRLSVEPTTRDIQRTVAAFFTHLEKDKASKKAFFDELDRKMSSRTAL